MKCRILRAPVVLAALVLAMGCDSGSPTAPRPTVARAQAAIDSGGPFMRALGGIADLSGRCPRISFVIGSIRVHTSTTTLFQRAECRELRAGSVVDASGARQSDGGLLAQEVELTGPR